MASVSFLKQALQLQADPRRAEQTKKFFKIGKGEYSEHDIFIGIAVPTLRQVAKKWQFLTLEEVKELLESKIHEERFLALLILILHYEKGTENTKEAVFQFVLTLMDQIDNWDLVDTIAPKVIGPYIYRTQKWSLLERWTLSSSLWERRIAIVSTWHFIRQGDFKWTLKLAESLKGDPHPLIHKALGWMLREVGKKDKEVLVAFLEAYRHQLPATTLSYALEKFSKAQRDAFRQGLALKA